LNVATHALSIILGSTEKVADGALLLVKAGRADTTALAMDALKVGGNVPADSLNGEGKGARDSLLVVEWFPVDNFTLDGQSRPGVIPLTA
jgi:hypothetical protein